MKIDEQILEMGRRAASAAPRLAGLETGTKNRILVAMADGIIDQQDVIAAANARDHEAAEEAGLSAAVLDRLRLDPQRIGDMAEGLRDVAGLEDPVGRQLAVTERPNGLVIRKVRVPLGVVVVIFESRPNVTADAAGLCFKAGNAVILRGGSEARESNAAIFDAMAHTLRDLLP